jgi:hypothetical protein
MGKGLVAPLDRYEGEGASEEVGVPERGEAGRADVGEAKVLDVIELLELIPVDPLFSATTFSDFSNTFHNLIVLSTVVSQTSSACLVSLTRGLNHIPPSIRTDVARDRSQLVGC